MKYGSLDQKYSLVNAVAVKIEGTTPGIGQYLQ